MFIKENLKNYSLILMIKILELKKSYWDKYKHVNLQEKDKFALQEIKKVFNENLKQFGYQEIDKELRQKGIIINHKKILRIMNTYGIRAQYVQKMIKKTLIHKVMESYIDAYPDLIQRKFNQVQTRFSVLYTDVTYHIWGTKRFYQSTIIDGHTKEIVHAEISKINDLKLVLDNLNGAIKQIKKIKRSEWNYYPFRSRISVHIKRLKKSMWCRQSYYINWCCIYLRR
ncbi:transposase [Williamsoniiplasma somnilux]|uniref:Transposase n=1 Tax=Williamsoniiplasma somnilux TaxID=215578 RepID=A0A2K8P1Y5_9MOLU|nr:IS3 family transposase [Williamsoniiplasma somnilux]ATZ19021.1 transposase [Williamsoniiplasma somnilux]